MITEDYVSFEVAKLLKEKGFKEITQAYINTDKEVYMLPFQQGVYELANKQYPYPTLQIVMKWLREVHNIFISVSITYIDNRLTYLWIPCVIKQGHIDYPTMEEYMADSYEEACEAAIKYCLTNLI